MSGSSSGVIASAWNRSSANLLGNAIKFTSAGQVELAVERVDVGRVRFRVTDTGIGFAPETAGDLFKPFQQADNSITRKFGATNSPRHLPRLDPRHGRADPRCRAPPAPARPSRSSCPAGLRGAHTGGRLAVATDPAPATPDDDASPVRVLVVDDHETNRAVVQLILGSIGADVTCAEDGEKGLAEFVAGRFDVVFMDMQMPVLDGLGAIRMIRAREVAMGLARTPVFMLSANAMPEHIEAARAAGADDHVAKPITPPRLIEAVQKALAMSYEEVATQRTG